MMTDVVEEGTGQAAQLEGLKVAGKTGTASTGGFSDGQPLDDAWFVGFAPVQDPKIAVAVTLENIPNGYGGIYAAPIAAQEIQDSAGGDKDEGVRSRGHDRREIPGALPPRNRGHGRRLPRRGSAARSSGRAEVAAPPLRRGPGLRRAVPPGGPVGCIAAAPERGQRLRSRGLRQHLLHRDGVPAGPVAEAADPAGGAARADAGDRPDGPDPEGRAGSRTAAA